MTSEFPLSEELRRRSAEARAVPTPYIIGVAGSVAVGKSTFAASLREMIEAWPEHPRAEIIATDGFLFSNLVLATRKISLRKGFPESFDVESLRQALAAIRRRMRVAVPRYSHVTYDIDPDISQFVERPGIVILDGLHLAQIESLGTTRLIDCLIYLDADEAAIEKWFTDRLLPLMEAGREDPESFYYAYRAMTLEEQRTFVARVWQNINLPNLREHIVKDRDAADLVLRKAADHRIASVTARAA